MNITPINRSEEQLEAASRWVLKISDGALSVSDQAALKTWLGEHTKHRKILLEVAAVWDKSDALTRLSDLFPHEYNSYPTQRLRWLQPWRLIVNVAASLAVLVIGGLLLFNVIDFQAESIPISHYETEIGGRKTVLLPDGSELELNTSTELTVNYTPSARIINLARGEILVRVAEDRDRPLSVVTKDRIIQAIGTEFLVEIAADDQVTLTVTDGEVVIGVRRSTFGLLVPNDAGVTVEDFDFVPPVLLHRDLNTVVAGEQIVMSSGDTERRAITADELEVKLSWQNGRLIFSSEPLERVLKEVERYTTVKFYLIEESLKSKTLTGRFRTGDVEALLESLRLNFQITHEYDGEDRVLLSNFVPR